MRGSRFGRDLRTATSSDFVNWNEPDYVDYTQGRVDEIYNNSILPYFRAPHIFVGFPTRYVDYGWSEAVEDLPELSERRLACLGERTSRQRLDGCDVYEQSRRPHLQFVAGVVHPAGFAACGQLGLRRRLSRLGHRDDFFAV